MSNTNSDNRNQKSERMSKGKDIQDSNKQQANPNDPTKKHHIGDDVKKDPKGPTASREDDCKATDKNKTGNCDSQMNSRQIGFAAH